LNKSKFMSSITPELLVVIDAIARHGSFAGAARELNKVPSAITYAVRRLEEGLDVLLFDRSGHRATPTPAGNALLDDGRQILASLDELSQRVKRVASGWEVELRVAVSAVLRWDPLYELIDRFQNLKTGTRLRFSTEVLNGNWDALTSGRADLVIGAEASSTPAGLARAQPLGVMTFAFCVAPHHPLASTPGPLTETQLGANCAVVVGDTARAIAPQTRGLLQSQSTLIMPTMQAKIEAQIRGLGCGYIARALATPYLDQGVLVERETSTGRPQDENLVYACSPEARGRALKWWLTQLQSPRLRHQLLGAAN
jgi:DNA-binding transcriptional LysR family regulator